LPPGSSRSDLRVLVRDIHLHWAAILASGL
jgi:hypothetical protein